MSERGQISVALVAAVTLVMLGGVLLGYLSQVAVGGGHAQRAADLAAIAAAKRLGADPGAPAAALRRTAAGSAGANGARIVSVRVIRTGAVPRAVDVTVAVAVDGAAPGAGVQHRMVQARARAGVQFAATLAAGSFRPVDLRGGRGPLAAVTAAEAQVGWPYVWGGESRAEGGFDCSGLIDYAYAAAGTPLPGRPTAAELWRMARPEPAAALEPSDLVFVGARSGAPDHVGMYVGDGTVVVAPHTGAQVRFEPLSAGGWDGFARLMPDAAAEPADDPAVEAAARAHQVPPDALAAELRLGLARDPETAAAALARAMRRHPGDLAAALSDAVGDPSAGALVLRSASGSGLTGFSSSVRLLPLPAAPAAAPAAGGGTGRGSGGGVDVAGIVAAAGKGLERAAEQLDHVGGRVPVQAAAGFRNVGRFGIAGLATFAPNRHLQDASTFFGAVWDGAEALLHAVGGGLVLDGPSLWVARLAIPVGLGFAGLYAWQAYTARRRDDQIWYGLQAASTAMTSIGAMTAGADLIAIGAGSAEVPPVGVALIVIGAAFLVGGCIYRERDWLAGGLRTGTGWVRNKVSGAAGAAVDAGRSVIQALNPF
ncbi:MAG TPA: C40 family peptidase [Gaiellales bacterium]